MKISNMLSKKELRVGVLFASVGLITGWLIFGNDTTNVVESKDTHVHENSTEYTCSMHPQIRQATEGDCPICGMDLISIDNGMDESDAHYTVKFTNSAMKIAEVSISKIFKKSPFKTLHLSGKVMADERNISELTARYSGRIEKLFINYKGQNVKKGDVLAKIYSPKLVSAQKELFEAIKFKKTNTNYYKAARNKLSLWGLSDDQISRIEKSGEAKLNIDIISPLSGTVTKRHVALGDYINEGESLFEIMDLSKIWVVFDAYESDLAWIKVDDIINFNIPSIPNESFESKVTFIDPIMNNQSRVAGIRAELSNSKKLLKPNMLASGKLQAMLPGNKEVLLVPKSAILWTGKNAVVYVKTDEEKNLFQYREIQLGADTGDYYVVNNGLEEGEFVASNGVFKIDAAAQLKGGQSMMNSNGHKVQMVSTNQMINEEFKNQIKDVFTEYIKLKDELVNSNAIQTSSKAKKLSSTLSKVDLKLIKGDAHLRWVKFLKDLNENLESIKNSDLLIEQRKAFLPLSESLYNVIRYFKIEGINAYYQFCPMANDNNGANWLSINDEIRNPYFGDAMLSCGETLEILE